MLSQAYFGMLVHAFGSYELADIVRDVIDTSIGASIPQPALTPQLTTITHTAPSTPDYALQALTDTGGFGFATADEGHSFLAVVANLQARVAELQTALVAAGIIAS